MDSVGGTRVPAGVYTSFEKPENWKCPYCGKVIVIRTIKDKSRVAGHLSSHKRKPRWTEKHFQKAIELFKKGWTPTRISKKLGISLPYLQAQLKKRLGKEYLDRRWTHYEKRKKTKKGGSHEKI
jgi:hypothetical protein